MISGSLGEVGSVRALIFFPSSILMRLANFVVSEDEAKEDLEIA